MKRVVPLAVALFIALGFVLWFVVWRSASPDGSVPNHLPDSSTESSDVTATPEYAETSREASRALDASLPLAHTIHDRAVRDAIRRQIFITWSRAGESSSIDASSLDPPDASTVNPLHAPMPTLDGGVVDPDYLRARIREDFIPMAQQCYEQWTQRAAHLGGASGGRLVVDFVILGDEHLGGVVDEATLEPQATDADADAAVLGDPTFHTCMRESMMAMAFQAPPGRGQLRVRYPFRFTPGDGGESAER